MRCFQVFPDGFCLCRGQDVAGSELLMVKVAVLGGNLPPSPFSPVVKKGFLLGLCILLTGCAQTRVTEPPRAAVEQLLLGTAADRALAQEDFAVFNRMKVYVDERYFEAYDEEYVLSAIRNALSSAGALLVANMNDAEVIIEARSGALATDASSSLLGVPSVPVPIPLAGTVVTPEIALYRSEKQFSTAKIALFGYWKESREHLHSSGNLVGTARHNYFTFLGYIKYTDTTLPEKRTGFGRGK